MWAGGMGKRGGIVGAPGILAALQVALAGVLVVASVGKALRTEEFATALRLTRLPEPAITPLGAALAVIELVLAGALLLTPPGGLPWAFATAVVLFLLFTGWMAWVRASRLRVRCGCFGTGSNEVGASTIGRNLVLVVGSVLGWWLATRVASPLPGPSLPMLVTVTAGGMILALGSGLRLAWPELALTFDRLQAREAPGARGA